jgi:hypothetical protein
VLRHREFRASNFSPDGTGSDRSFRVVTNALALSGFAVSHEAESAIIFREPDRSANGNSILTEGCKADIALTLNFAGNRGHVDIVKRSQAFLQPRDLLVPGIKNEFKGREVGDIAGHQG